MTTLVRSHSAAAAAASQSADRTAQLGTLVLAIGLGLGLLFVSGYAQATVLHDAAHDQRHAMAFPCH